MTSKKRSYEQMLDVNSQDEDENPVTNAAQNPVITPHRGPDSRFGPFNVMFPDVSLSVNMFMVDTSCNPQDDNDVTITFPPYIYSNVRGCCTRFGLPHDIDELLKQTPPVNKENVRIRNGTMAWWDRAKNDYTVINTCRPGFHMPRKDVITSFRKRVNGGDKLDEARQTWHRRWWDYNHLVKFVINPSAVESFQHISYLNRHLGCLVNQPVISWRQFNKDSSNSSMDTFTAAGTVNDDGVDVKGSRFVNLVNVGDFGERDFYEFRYEGIRTTNVNFRTDEEAMRYIGTLPTPPGHMLNAPIVKLFGDDGDVTLYSALCLYQNRLNCFNPSDRITFDKWVYDSRITNVNIPQGFTSSRSRQCAELAYYKIVNVTPPGASEGAVFQTPCGYSNLLQLCEPEIVMNKFTVRQQVVRENHVETSVRTERITTQFGNPVIEFSLNLIGDACVMEGTLPGVFTGSFPTSQNSPVMHRFSTIKDNIVNGLDNIVMEAPFASNVEPRYPIYAATSARHAIVLDMIQKRVRPQLLHVKTGGAEFMHVIPNYSLVNWHTDDNQGLVSSNHPASNDQIKKASQSCPAHRVLNKFLRHPAHILHNVTHNEFAGCLIRTVVTIAAASMVPARNPSFLVNATGVAIASVVQQDTTAAQENKASYRGDWATSMRIIDARHFVAINQSPRTSNIIYNI